MQMLQDVLIVVGCVIRKLADVVVMDKILNDLLDDLFGNKIQIITARKLNAYYEFEQQFMFHKDHDEQKIRNFLFDNLNYSVMKVRRFRTKKHKSPELNHYKEITDEKVVRNYI